MRAESDRSRSRRKLGPALGERDMRIGDQLRSDDVAAWEQRCAPVLNLLANGGMTTTEVRSWGRRCRTRDGHFGSNLAEECLYWLQARGRVVRGDDRK
jgi:hypothetical protein